MDLTLACRTGPCVWLYITLETPELPNADGGCCLSVGCGLGGGIWEDLTGPEDDGWTLLVKRGTTLAWEFALSWSLEDD